MRTSTNFMLAALALGMSRAFAADPVPAGFVTDASGYPVLGSTDTCWRSSAWTPGMAGACPASSRAARVARPPLATRFAEPARSTSTMQQAPAGQSGAGQRSIADSGAGLVDSSGQGVRGSFGQCWGTGFSRPEPGCGTAGDTAIAAATAAGTQTPRTAADWLAGGQGGMAVGQSQATIDTTGAPPPAARGNPGYLTDSSGLVVRSGQGECWHTGSWTPALATVVGCDGVLAKAAPVPAPAPSPSPTPPADRMLPDETLQSDPEVRRMPEAGAVPTDPEPPLEVAPAPDAAEATPLAQAPTRPRAGQADLVPPLPAPPSPPPTAGADLVPSPSRSPRTAADAAPPEALAEGGLQAEKVVLETDTYFDFDKSTLKPAGKRKLDELASRLSTTELEVVVATGHTDWIGTNRYNQKLSERRARSVKDYLVSKGIPEGRIFTEGKGERQPVATNKTTAGRALNRRVEVEVVGIRQVEIR